MCSFFSLLVSGLPLTQVESIHEIRDDINWLLQDEIVFSLCHVPFISKSILNSVTEHIIKSQDMETSSSYFNTIRLDFVLEQEISHAIFMEELDKTRIGKYIVRVSPRIITNQTKCTDDFLKHIFRSNKNTQNQNCLRKSAFLCLIYITPTQYRTIHSQTLYKLYTIQITPYKSHYTHTTIY